MLKCPKLLPPQRNKVFSVLLLGNGMLPVLPTNFSQAVPEKAQAGGHQHRAWSLPMLKKPQY